MANSRGVAALVVGTVESCGSIPYAARVNKAGGLRLPGPSRAGIVGLIDRPQDRMGKVLRPMNVVERSPPRVAAEAAAAEPTAPADASAANPAAERGTKLRPLASLIPYVRRYRGRAMAAFLALIVAALATLAVPIAVRRMIDFGFTQEGLNLIDSYFSVMIAVAAVLALASAARYYLVTTLGERIVADLRTQVFAHLTALSIPFFDQTKTGEVLSKLTADTTQIKAAAGSSLY